MSAWPGTHQQCPDHGPLSADTHPQRLPTRPVLVRIGDNDRTRVASLLGEHYAQGRLDVAELDERRALALSATHQHELDALLADLPSLDTGLVPEPAGQAAGTPARRRPPVALLVVLGIALTVVTQGAALLFLPVLWWTVGPARRRCHHRPPADTQRSALR